MLYRWKNPKTTCDHPFLAVAEDGSATLELGDYHLSIEAGVPDEHAQWLAQDFALTNSPLSLDLLTIQGKLNAAFAGDADFISARFDALLRPTQLDLSLPNDDTHTEGPEYLIAGLGSYQRFYRYPRKVASVRATERAMLDAFLRRLQTWQINMASC
jgi:hypothetical protein